MWVQDGKERLVPGFTVLVFTVPVRVKQNKEQKTNDNSSEDCKKSVVVGRIAVLGVVA